MEELCEYPNQVDNDDLRKQIKFYAIELLSRREHSRGELLTKVAKKFPDNTNSSLVIGLLDELQLAGYQSDERFIEAFINSRIARGQGPLRIAQELRHRGLDTELINDWVDAKNAQWYELAKQTRERKFGLGEPETPKDKNKQLRFLQYRGFMPEQVFKALS